MRMSMSQRRFAPLVTGTRFGYEMFMPTDIIRTNLETAIVMDASVGTVQRLDAPRISSAKSRPCE